MCNGTTIEKICSIFIIFDTDENGTLSKNDLIEYFKNLFNYIFLKMKIKYGESQDNISKILIDQIANGKEEINMIDMIRFFENINLENM